MEKQYKLQIKDYLITRVAKKLQLSESICESVIKWSYTKAREATKTSNSIEMAGIGTFKLHTKSIGKKIKAREEMLERCEAKLDNNLIPVVRKKVEDSISYTKEYIEWLKEKQNKLDGKAITLSETDS